MHPIPKHWLASRKRSRRRGSAFSPKSTSAEKLGIEFRDYAILGACNPPLSHRALFQELDAGLVLPCNVVVYEDGEGTGVVIADPEIIVQTLGRLDLEGMARDAREKIEQVAAALRG